MILLNFKTERLAATLIQDLEIDDHNNKILGFISLSHLNLDL